MRLVALLVCLLALVPTTAFAAEAEACTDTANVTWETNWEDVTVTGAIVEVPGCEDGDQVGLQLLTDDGDLPAEPLVSEVEAEHAWFDLAPLDVRIEPVIGVRVLLYGEAVIEIVGVVVEQRFFGQTGNEQRGLRRTTALEVPVGGQYLVPGAPTRYDVAVCAEMNTTLPGDLIGQGAGTFTATEAGTHVVCYQQQPGTPGGPPDVEDPSVGDETDALGDSITQPAPSTGGGGLGGLAATGTNIVVGGALALVLLMTGRRLVGLRRG
jgi:hypothetical protein